jgi:acyl-CoA thioester hydrolase
MANFTKSISVRWSDLDPNFHLRHSVYYDFGAQQRIEILQEMGLTPKIMQEQHFGPVIFREECLFKREIRLAEEVRITARVAKMKADGSRWTIQHEFLSADDKVLAVITVDGAWMDTNLRKLATPTPKIVIDVLDAFPKTDDYGL